MRTNEGWSDDRLLPLLAGVLALLAWLLQWHNALDPQYGMGLGDFFRSFVEEEARRMGKTLEEVRAWVPLGLSPGLESRRKRKRYGRCLALHVISRLDQIHLRLYAVMDPKTRVEPHLGDLLDREDLAQAVLDVIWEAWSQVGVMRGTRVSATGRIVDPEPLLLLTWQSARQDPCVFDEVLDWLVRNGRWVNVVRLSTLLKDDSVCEPSVAGAVAAFMTQHDKGPKWRLLAERQRPAVLSVPSPFFRRHGKPLTPLGEERDETSARYGWARSPVSLRGQSQPMPAWTPTSLVLKSRAFFGVNIRADVFAWLVAQPSCQTHHPQRKTAPPDGYPATTVGPATLERTGLARSELPLGRTQPAGPAATCAFQSGAAPGVLPAPTLR